MDVDITSYYERKHLTECSTGISIIKINIGTLMVQFINYKFNSHLKKLSKLSTISIHSICETSYLRNVMTDILKSITWNRE